MAQTLEDRTVRFLREDHSDLQNVRVYGSLSDSDAEEKQGTLSPFKIKKIDVATDRITIDINPLKWEAQNAQIYFGLDKWVQVDPLDSSAFAPDWAAEGEGNIYTATTTGDVPDPTDGNTDNSEITNVVDTSALSVGMLVTGTNIPAGATIASIDSYCATTTGDVPRPSHYRLQSQQALDLQMKCLNSPYRTLMCFASQAALLLRQ